MTEPLPLLLVAGHFGAGKTLLIGRWLADPELGGALIVVNEPAEATVDASFLSSASRPAAFVGGCACCEASAALLDALHAALDDRGKSRISRIVVELSGLADPTRVLAAIQAEAALREALRVEGVITVVDALEGERALEWHREAVAQVVMADALVIAKADLVSDAAIDRLQARLSELNPHAPVTRSSEGSAHPQLVVGGLQAASARDERYMKAAHATAPNDTRSVFVEGGQGVHSPAIVTTTLRPAQPVDAERLRSRVEGFVERHGARVLRVKALVPIEGRPGPAVVDVVAGMLYPVRLLARWPGSSQPVMVVTAEAVAADSLASLIAEPEAA